MRATHLSLSLYMYIYICIRPSIDLHACIETHITSRHATRWRCTWIHIYIYIYIHIHTYMCICRYVCIHIYICILSSSRKPSVHCLMVSVVDDIQCFLFMVSVVGILLWFPSSQETFSYGFRLCFCSNGFRRGRKTLLYGFRRWFFGGFCRRRRIHNFRAYRAIPRFCFCAFRTGFRRWLIDGFRYVLLWLPLCFLWFPSLDFSWILPPQEDPKL